MLGYKTNDLSPYDFHKGMIMYVVMGLLWLKFLGSGTLKAMYMIIFLRQQLMDQGVLMS